MFAHQSTVAGKGADSLQSRGASEVDSPSWGQKMGFPDGSHDLLPLKVGTPYSNNAWKGPCPDPALFLAGPGEP